MLDHGKKHDKNRVRGPFFTTIGRTGSITVVDPEPCDELPGTHICACKRNDMDTSTTEPGEELERIDRNNDLLNLEASRFNEHDQVPSIWTAVMSSLSTTHQGAADFTVHQLICALFSPMLEAHCQGL
jgi:hypothetical protein